MYSEGVLLIDTVSVKVSIMLTELNRDVGQL